MIGDAKTLVGNRLEPTLDAEWFEVQSPFTEATIGRAQCATEEQIERAVRAARDAFDSGPWPRLSIAARAEALARLVESLNPLVDALVERQIVEVGLVDKAIAPPTRRVSGAGYLQSEVDLATLALEPSVRSTSGGVSFVEREPLGVSVQIVPWNGPVPGLLLKAIPALLAGCPVIIKTSQLAPLSASLVAEAIADAGLPDGLVSILHGGPDVGERLIRHSGVDHVSFTGSTHVGRSIGAMCGALLKPATLELGGKSAAIILADADIDHTVPLLVSTAVPNSGQVCWATTRILVPAATHHEWADALAEALRSLRIGDPQDSSTDIGPLATERQRTNIERSIAGAIDQGARLTVGGRRPASIKHGWFIEPTLLTDVRNAMDVAQHELFGPVVALIPYESDQSAVELANDSEYGLGGAVHSRDPVRALEVARQIRTGTCAVNAGLPAGGGGPFGGFKASGLGRERGLEGYHYLTQTRSITLTAADGLAVFKQSDTAPTP